MSDALPLEESLPKPNFVKIPKDDVRQIDLTGFQNLPTTKVVEKLTNKNSSSKIGTQLGDGVSSPILELETSLRYIEKNQNFDVPEKLKLFLNSSTKPKNFRVIGMFKECQILMEHTDGLAIADIHNIHKALIESFLKKSQERNSVRLNDHEVPLLLEMKAQDVLILQLHQNQMIKCGFQIESFGGTTFSISSLPFPLPKEKCALVLKDFINRVSAYGKRTNETEIRTDLIRCIAFHASFEKETHLNHSSMNMLIAQMEQENLPAYKTKGERLWFLIPQDEIIKRSR